MWKSEYLGLKLPLQGIRDSQLIIGGAEVKGHEDEIKDVIGTGVAIPAKYGKMGKSKVYKFKQNRLGNYYEEKKVEVFCTVEGDVIITVTVYVFYGKWEV